MHRIIFSVAIVAGILMADTADGQFLKRLFSPAPIPSQGPWLAPQFESAQPSNNMRMYQASGKIFSPDRAELSLRQQPYNYYYYQRTPRQQQMLNQYRRSPMNVVQQQYNQSAQQGYSQCTMATIQTPYGPRNVRVRIPNMDRYARSAAMPQMQRPQQGRYQQRPGFLQMPMQANLQQPTFLNPSASPTMMANGAQRSQTSTNILETSTPMIPSLSAPAEILSDINDNSSVVPASANFVESNSLDPISLDDVAPTQIPELNAPASQIIDTTSGAPSILKKK